MRAGGSSLRVSPAQFPPPAGASQCLFRRAGAGRGPWSAGSRAGTALAGTPGAVSSCTTGMVNLYAKMTSKINPKGGRMMKLFTFHKRKRLMK
ncbi:unnamed protein product [Caretta caretta]